MIGVLGGTSFREETLNVDARQKRVVTPYGSVDVSITVNGAVIDRHGATAYTPPHRINHHAHIDALLRIGAVAAVSVGSVGSLREELAPGTLVLVDDLFMPRRLVTGDHDRIRYTVPEFDQRWRSGLLNELRASGLEIRDGGVYAETVGPRFETKAEIRALARDADVVGMTCGSEAVLAMERSLPHAVIAVVDNFAHGIGGKQLSGERFQEQVRQNRALALKALNVILDMKYQEI
jgi:5'-methylthioadenosine phosphorylase